MRVTQILAVRLSRCGNCLPTGGVNGQHYRPHNASFAVATTPAERYTGIRAAATAGTELGPVVVRTVALNCTGSNLVVTADTAVGTAGRLRAQVVGVPSLGLADSQAISGRNVTDATMAWTRSAHGLESQLGKRVIIEVELSGGAALYSFGFA